jgi:Subtilase family
MAWFEALENPMARHEAAIIVRAFAARGIDIIGVPTDDGGVAYMYAADRLLTREQYLGGQGPLPGFQDIPTASNVRGVLDVLQRYGFGTVEITRVVRDIVRIRFNPGEGEVPNDEQPDARSLLRLITEELGTRFATLDQVVTSAQGHPTGCPATEPQEVYDPEPTPYPPVCPGKGGDGVRIYVADTGIVKNTVTGPNCPWLAGVTGDDDLSVLADGTILSYGGHGTFVAGVIRCMAPGTEIVVRNVFDIAGSALESDFVPKLYEGFAYGAEIFHVTVASPTKDNLPLIAFEAWMEDLRQCKGVVCVVPAGNYGRPEPHWPAAFPGLISVGALATDWRNRAYFSDYGGWVDVYAPGQNLVNAFATGTFVCQVAPYAGEVRTFSDMAQWSGTSFSTPIVTGLIAARMTRCGESAQEAAAALLAKARSQAIPGLGPVLLPCCDDDDPCHRRHGHDSGCGHRHDCGCSHRHDCGHGHGCGPGKHDPMHW